MFYSCRPGLPSVIISNYAREFLESGYHSVYDTAGRAGYDYSAGPGQPVVGHLARLTDTLARTVLGLATTGEISSILIGPALMLLRSHW